MLIQIITHTIEVNTLDTITKHLTDINHQLAAIKSDTAKNDAIEKLKNIGLVAGPLLTGYIVFMLNRNKEYKIKKSELSGDIYMWMAELQRVRNKRIAAMILYNGNKRCYELLNDTDYKKEDQDLITGIYNESVHALDKSDLEESEAYKNFLKYIGQYRFYLSSEKKKELDKLIQPISIKEKMTYEFLDLTEFKQISVRIQEVIDAYNKANSMKNAKVYSDIEQFIDDNEEEII